MAIPLQFSDIYFLLRGALMTLLLSAASFLLGGAVAILLGMVRTTPRMHLLRWIGQGYIVLFRGTPLLLQLFLAYFGLSILGYDINRFAAALFALTAYASAYLADIVVAGIESVGKGQWEAGRAFGMTYLQIMRHVVGPQAVKVMIPPTVGFLAQLIKGTALVAVLNYVELAKAGNILVLRTYQPLLVYTIVAVIYFVICYPISLLGQHLEGRLRVHA